MSSTIADHREIDGLPKTVAFEGGRGPGKTTAAKTISEILTEAGHFVAVNRGDPDSLPDGITRITEDKASSITHQEAIRVHEAWKDSFDTNEGRLIPHDPSYTFGLSYRKFVLGVAELVKEFDNYRHAVETSDVVILDRDLDTVIAYGAAELILSNPKRFPDLASRRELIQRLWLITGETLGILGRAPADITIYFETLLTANALQRSHDVRVGTNAQYEIDPFQVHTQEMIEDLFDITLDVRRDMFPDKRIHKLTVDGKSPDEVASMVLILMKKRPGRMITEVAPLELPNNIEPKSIEELIELLSNYSAGAAFPARWEVAEYGASNCVYSNASLVAYARYYGLGELYFTEVTHSNDIGSSPVHWCTLQFDQGNTKCRVIDITPFNDVYIGEWQDYTFENGEVTLSDNRFSTLTLDDPESAIKYMEFANQVETCNQPDLIDFNAQELIRSADNESKYVFASVRYSRALGRQDRNEEAVRTIRSAFERYPKNLILVRELAKLVRSGSLTDCGLKDRFIEAWERIQNMSVGKGQEGHAKHMAYYGDILEAMNFLN